MNAAARKLSIADAILGEDLATQRQRFRAVVNRLRNNDTLTEERVVENLIAGLPAFWSTATYSDQIASNVLWEINHGRPIIDAIDARKSHPLWEKFRPAILDGLIPLNARATADLLAAYSMLGAWREADELEARRAA